MARAAAGAKTMKSVQRRVGQIPWISKPHDGPSMLRLTGLLAFAAFAASGMPLAAHGQTYPVRSVPFPAGGASDVVARIVTEHMGRTLGVQMVIENVGGA